MIRLERAPTSAWCFIVRTFEESLAMGKANERGRHDTACAPYQNIGKETTNQYRKVKPCIANTVLAGVPNRAMPLKGLSRMMGNYHVRFLGENGAATPLTYPALLLSSEEVIVASKKFFSRLCAVGLILLGTQQVQTQVYKSSQMAKAVQMRERLLQERQRLAQQSSDSKPLHENSINKILASDGRISLQVQTAASLSKYLYPQRSFPRPLVPDLWSETELGEFGQLDFSWTSNLHNPTDTSLPFKHHFVHDIEISPNFAVDRTIIALISESSEMIYKSTDGGATWQPTPAPLPGKTIADVAFAPNFASNHTVVALINPIDLNDLGFVVVSDDGGNTWQAIAERQSLSGAKVAVSPIFSADSTIFVAQGKDLYHVKNKLYTRLVLQRPAQFPADINQVAFSPDFPRDSTMLVSTSSNSSGGGLFSSKDGGFTWAQITRSLITAFRPARSESFEVMAVSPGFSTDSTIFVVLVDAFGGTQALWRSTNAGASWDSLRTIDIGFTGRGISSMAVSPDFSNDGRLFVGSAVGVQGTSNRGEQWEFTNQGLDNLVVESLAISPDFATDQTLFTGTHKGIFKSTDGGLSWHSSSQGIPKSSLVNLSNNPFFLDTIPSVAVDSSGTVHVVWWGTHLDPNSPDGVSTDVTYSRKVAGEFEQPIIIPVESGFYSKDIALTVEPNGRVHIVFRRAVDQLETELADDLFYVSGANGVFDAPTLVVDGNRNFTDEWDDGPNSPAIAVDHLGNVHIVYVELFGDLFYTDNRSGEFSQPTRMKQDAEAPNLKMDASGNLHLAYISRNTDEVRYAYGDFTGFLPAIRIGLSRPLARAPGLAIEPSGTVHIVYEDRNQWTNYISGKDSTFNEPVVIRPFTGSHRGSAIAVDQFGFAHIAYIVNGHDLIYATNKSGQFETLVVTSGIVHFMTSGGLALGPDNILHLVWHRPANTIFSDNDFDIFYAEFASNGAALHHASGAILNLDGSIPSDGEIIFNARIISRPDEILTENSFGNGYQNGQWSVQCASFASQWQVGDILHVDFTNTATGQTASVSDTLTSADLDLFPTVRFGQTTGINDATRLPKEFHVSQNYPNPFNPETTIKYQLPHAAEVKLEIFNLLGQRVATLVEKRQPAGYYTAQWDGRDSAGTYVASGVYLYRLQTENFVKVRKLVLVR